MKRKDRINKEETKEILSRRTEKMWRHEDREISTSHALWNTVFAIHAAMIGAVGIFVGNNKFPLAQIGFNKNISKGRNCRKYAKNYKYYQCTIEVIEAILFIISIAIFAVVVMKHI